MMSKLILIIVCFLAYSALGAEQRPRWSFQDEQRIQELIQNEIRGDVFWQNFAESRYRDVMKIIIKKQMESVLNEFESNIKKNNKDEFKTFERTRIPNLVANEISHQMPGFLNTNPHMQEILNGHSLKLSQQLSKVAKDVISTISNEEQYHIMQTEIRKHAEERVAKMMADHEIEFREKLEKIQDRVKAELSGIIRTNARMNLLSETVEYLEMTYQKQLWKLWTTFIVTVCSFVLYLYFK